MPRVTFLNDDLSIEVPEGTSLQLAIRDADASVPFGCRAGTCASCVCRVVAGAETLDEPGFVEEDTIAVVGEDVPGTRLACQMFVGSGDLQIEW